MSIKRNNRFFFFCMLIVSLGQLACSEFLPRWGLYELVPYLVCLLIGILMLKKETIPFTQALPYKVGVKPKTALFIILLVFAMSPLSNALAAIGSIIGGDALSLVDTVLMGGEKSFFESLFEIAVIPAVFEEMFFRGFFYTGFKRARGARFAIIFSSVLFGFFHMNIQQICYAIVLGIVIALLREMTGSMWAGMLYHFVNNGWSVVSMSVPEDSFFLKLPLERVTFMGTGSAMVYDCVVAVLCTAAAVWLLILIARTEAKTDSLKHFFPLPEGTEKKKACTAALVFGCIFLVLFTFLTTLMLKTLENPAFADFLNQI